MTPEERQQYWESIHRQDDYSTVWSMLDDPVIRTRICSSVASQQSHARVLVPGCGSRVLLEPELLQIPGVQTLVATDYPEVVALCRERLMPPRDGITFESRNSSNLGWNNHFDVAVVVNSVLSDSDTENRAIMSSILEALRPGGVVIGYFPTAFCGFEIGVIAPETGWQDLVNIHKSTFFEEQMNVEQIFYTPLRLRSLLLDCGFSLESMHIDFLDSPFCVEQAKNYYQLPDGLLIYEFFVVARKPATQ
jgi:SAM-dependent methyltransferase